ncbi:cytochrome c oxidase assembly protein [Amorphus sp. 3PC139-8]|uniref:cytochrome c oxidase assembly protein n=1 Tax=Amorphus sp. 3PC139-8 TaxID=2735676 RepID=UPI00345CD6F8
MGETTDSAGKKGRNNLPLALACVAFVGAMVGAAYAAVPLYQLFCQVTGYGGTTTVATAAPIEPIDREITVRFDANVSAKVPWTFKPVDRSIKSRLGEVVEAEYVIENTSDRPTAAQAVFNVTPFAAGAYFSKLDCFCFTEQTLGPGEKRRVTVTYYVDPEMVEDHEANKVGTITLSYTFFPAAVAADANGAETEALAKPTRRL